jgi:hypothetical protein
MATLSSYDSSTWQVTIDENQDLRYYEKTIVRGKKGVKIVRIWGKAPDGNPKLKTIFYPKSAYSLDKMNKLMKKYDDCNLCKIGRTNLKFINNKNNIKNMKQFSIINGIGKIPKVGPMVSRNEPLTRPIIMQSLATISRLPMDMVLPEVLRKIAYLGIGGVGAGLAYKKISDPQMQSEWIDFFANYIAMVFDPTPAQMNKMASEINQIRAAISTRSMAPFKATFASGSEIKMAVNNLKNAIGLGSLSFGLGRAFGKLGFNWKKQLKVSEGTGPSSRAYSREMAKGFHATSNVAEDFGYVDTSKRFKDISKFSRGFDNKKRFRLAGINQG